MYIKELYLFNKLSYDLASKHQFTILHIDKNKKEIWMEKKIKSTSHIIRIIHRTFDWKNHLKKDIGITFEKIKRIKKMLVSNKIKIHNIYVATYPPVDSWESLKKPLKLKNKSQIEMAVYYLDKNDFVEERKRLYDDLGMELEEIVFPEELEMEQLSNYLEYKLISIHNQRVKEEKQLFKNGRPILTTTILFLNLIMFALIESYGSSTSTATLVDFGAKYNPAILNGEWWRILSSMFIHIGTLHLLMNMLALYFVGSFVEKIYGTTRFGIIYFLAGILGGLTSFALNPQIAAGASGAIFGLFGALLFFGLNNKKVFFQTIGYNVIFVIIINIVFGLSVPQVDNGAHIGGLIGGFLGSAITFFPQRKKSQVQFLSLFIFVLICLGLIFYGLSNTSTDSIGQVQAQLSQERIQNEDYQRAVETATYGIEHSTEYRKELLFFRSYALIQLDKVEPSVSDLEQVVKLDPEFAPAHYNLALIYEEVGEVSKAITHANEAVRLEPDNEMYKNLDQRLSKMENFE